MTNHSRRRIVRDVLHHCYQRTVDRVLIFYCVSDFLVFFTVLSVVAAKHKVRLLSLCLMADHLHLSIVEEGKGELAAFVRDYSARFSRLHNQVCHCSGPLFEPQFGCAPKIGDKRARTNLIYVGNNAPERRLCKNAEEYRWNFLAYAVSDHPFSDKYVAREASYALKNARKVVLSRYEKSLPLSYEMLKNLLAPLTRKEKEQFVDIIVSTYNMLDYASALRFFDGYDAMLTAMHASTGSEYDLNEVFVGKSDAYYAKMSALVVGELGFGDVHDVLALPADEKFRIFQYLLRMTDALPEQIASFLRMPLQRTKH